MQAPVADQLQAGRLDTDFIVQSFEGIQLVNELRYWYRIGLDRVCEVNGRRAKGGPSEKLSVGRSKLSTAGERPGVESVTGGMPSVRRSKCSNTHCCLCICLNLCYYSCDNFPSHGLSVVFCNLPLYHISSFKESAVFFRAPKTRRQNNLCWFCLICRYE